MVRLAPGLLGTPATRLLAALLLWQFFSAVEARAVLPATKRTPFFAYIDEVAALGSLPLPLDGLLEQARGLGVGLTLAPQSLGQLSPALRSGLLANVGSLVAFRLASDEAKLIARELPGVSSEQLGALGRFEVAMKLSLGPGHVSSAMTGRTVPMDPTRSDPAAIRRLSGERFGMTIEDGRRRAGRAARTASERAVSDYRGRGNHQPRRRSVPAGGRHEPSPPEVPRGARRCAYRIDSASPDRPQLRRFGPKPRAD